MGARSSLPGMGARIIRHARQRHKLSQSELSRRSGVPQSLISRYERGLVEPGMAAVQRLLNAAGAVMTIDVDGARMIDTTRFPTPDESEAMEADARRRAGPSPGSWASKLRESQDTGRLAFPHHRDGS